MLVDETHEMNLLGMFHQLPQSMELLAEALPASFRTGIGHDYDTLGPRGRGRVSSVASSRGCATTWSTICCPGSTASSTG